MRRIAAPKAPTAVAVVAAIVALLVLLGFPSASARQRRATV